MNDNDTYKAGFRPADDSGVPVPSRRLILGFLGESSQPMPAGVIEEHFDTVTKPGRKALGARLERMCHQGLLIRDRKGRYALPANMDIVPGRVAGHPNGHGFVIPEDGSDRLFLHHRQMRKVLHGDVVLARLKSIDGRGRKEGVIIEVVVDPEREIVGHYHVESGVAFVEPDDTRFARDIAISKERSLKAKNGDIVVTRILQHPVEHHHAVGEVVEILGDHLEPGMETEIAVRKHGLPDRWPESLLDEVKRLDLSTESVKPVKGRSDLRELPLVTIDGEDARDFDDAVYCEPHKDGGWRLLVAIADVSHYVTPGSELDQEALNRGNSAYFPRRVIPMLPEELSNGICSLNPNENRYCMVCDMHIDAAGVTRKSRFYPAIMHSHARLTYDLMYRLGDRCDPALREQWSNILSSVDDLYRLFRVLEAGREDRGAIDFAFPEPGFVYDEDGKITGVVMRERLSSHRLIEECMLAVNVSAANFLKQSYGDAAMYRNHEGPDAEGITELRRLLGGLGLKLGGGDDPRAGDYATLVNAVSDRPEISPMVQMLLLRSLSQAEYSAASGGHFALAFPDYTHFTSPIRRYSDLVVHRLIRDALTTRPGRADDATTQVRQQVAELCSFSERRAEDASRDVAAWLKAEFMLERVGERFTGVATSVREFGVFVQLDEVFVDGLVHVTDLGDDYFHYDPLRFQLVGERSGRRFCLGDRLEVVVTRVDLEQARIDFDLCDKVSGGKKKSAGDRKRKKSGKGGGKRRR